MPLTAKGEEILASMKKEYGAEKGEEVFYASKNAGKITGVDGMIYDWGQMWTDEPAKVTTESPAEEKREGVKTTGDGIKLGEIHRRFWGR
jgi:hypothetical protein